MKCRSCQGKTKDLFTFGGNPPDLVMCTTCTLVQLKERGEPLVIDNFGDYKEFSVMYIGSILENEDFDIITSDTPVYFSLYSLEYFLRLHDYQITYVKAKGIWLHVSVRHVDSVIKLREKEEQMKLDKWGTYFLFALKHRKEKK